MQVHIFPGQGAQFKGMGKDLFDDFKTLTAKASSILDYDLAQLCLEDPESKLTDTRYTQPALFTVCFLSWIKHYEDSSIQPDVFAGHSLGELTALCLSNVIDFEQALELVRLRGELMSKANGGGMLAIIGDTVAEVGGIIQKYPDVYIANFNTDNQIVVSGEVSSIDALQDDLKNQPWQVVRLVVGGAFHSGLMVDAATEFRRALNDIELRAPTVPVIANLTALPYPHDSDEIKDILSQQICSPVKWAESIRYIRKFAANDGAEYEEFGPRQVLSGMMSEIA